MDKSSVKSTQIFVYCHLGKTQASSSSCSCEGELAEQDTHQVLIIVVAIVIVINIVFCRPVLQSFSQKNIIFPNYCYFITIANQVNPHNQLLMEAGGGIFRSKPGSPQRLGSYIVKCFINILDTRCKFDTFMLHQFFIFANLIAYSIISLTFDTRIVP